jgi:hypothetical protein
MAVQIALWAVVFFVDSFGVQIFGAGENGALNLSVLLQCLIPPCCAFFSGAEDGEEEPGAESWTWR